MSSNIREFKINIDKGLLETRQNATLFVKKVAFDVLTSVVNMSPVDTGRFKGNWVVGVTRAVRYTVDNLDVSGDSTIKSGFAELAKYKLGDVVYINNNLPYARRLENGYSAQASQGMVAVTLANVKTALGGR